MQEIAAFAKERGLLLYTRPAEQSLFPWYEEKLGAEKTVFFQNRQLHSACVHDTLPCQRIPPDEYGAARERHLTLTPHILLSENFLRLQEIYSDGYYAVCDGCCCVVKENDTLHILELLAPDDQTELCVQSLLKQFGTQKAILREVGSASDEPGLVYTGMILPACTNWGFFLE